MSQVKQFGDLGFSEMKNIGGVAKSSIKSMLYRMQQGFRTTAEAKKLSGRLAPWVIGDVSSITNAKDRENTFPNWVNQEVGKTLSRSLRVYF